MSLYSASKAFRSLAKPWAPFQARLSRDAGHDKMECGVNYLQQPIQWPSTAWMDLKVVVTPGVGTVFC